MQTRKPTIKANQPTTTPTSKPSITKNQATTSQSKPTACSAVSLAPKQKSGTKPPCRNEKNLR
jgi:hypothetical protein